MGVFMDRCNVYLVSVSVIYVHQNVFWPTRISLPSSGSPTVT